MNEAFDLRSGDTHIEVHKFRGGTIIISTALALILQAFLPINVSSKVSMVDLPLLITIYFGLSRRNPSTGLLLGMVIGLLQDSLSKFHLGVNGLAKTLVGYLASSIGARLDTEHPLARFALTILFYAVQQGILALIQRWLLNSPAPWLTARLAIAALVNAFVGVVLYFVLDRLRTS